MERLEFGGSLFEHRVVHDRVAPVGDPLPGRIVLIGASAPSSVRGCEGPQPPKSKILEFEVEYCGGLDLKKRRPLG